MKKQSKPAKKAVKPVKKSAANGGKKKVVAAKKAYRNPNAVNRSIGFQKPLYAYLKARAQAEGRSVNWLVNDLVSKDLVSKDLETHKVPVAISEPIGAASK